MQDNLLTVAQAAKRKGTSRASVYSAIARKRLPYQLVLGHIAIRDIDVDAWQPLPPSGGRRKGTTVSDEVRQRMAEGQRRRWERQRDNQDSTKRPQRTKK